MARLITTEELQHLAVAVDAAAEERGWNEGPMLVRVEDGESPDDGLLGFKSIDGHPLDTLLGFAAPASWQALGVCAEGWAASTEHAQGARPSKAKGRMRIRSTCLVSRDGAVASGMRLAGGEFDQMGEPVGTIPDALKRALGVATAPPDAPFYEWVARMLFGLIIGDAGASSRGHRLVPWAQLRPSLERYKQLAEEGSWETLRGLATKRASVVADLEPDVAAWMDEGMFSRWVLGGMASYDHLLDEARRSMTEEAFRQVRRLLRTWGLPVRMRRAA